MDGLVRVSCPRCGVRREDSQPRPARAEVCRSCGHTWSWSAEQVEDFWRARVGLHFRKRSEPYAGLVCRLVSVDPLTLFSVSGDLGARPSRERFDLDWQEVAGATDDDEKASRHMADMTRALAREGLQVGVSAVPMRTDDDWRAMVGRSYRTRGDQLRQVAMLTHIGSPSDVMGLRLLTGNGDTVASKRETFDLEWEEVRQVPEDKDARIAALEKQVALLEGQLEQAARYPGDR